MRIGGRRRSRTSGFSDDDSRRAGASLDSAAAVWAAAELLVKVREPIAAEYGYLREDLTLFTYLHLAADRLLTEALISAGTTAVAYETVQTADRALPLLARTARTMIRQLKFSVTPWPHRHPGGGRPLRAGR
ncbi:hypothetical protein [Streptomyces sp. NPDC058142]|uniref:hypothetical protein n=1 Tax=Streptomyces sp. NPDC058142 TaxID=3346355 RepID=UPI0036ED0051